jgi:hypothetical protein
VDVVVTVVAVVAMIRLAVIKDNTKNIMNLKKPIYDENFQIKLIFVDFKCGKSLIPKH